MRLLSPYGMDLRLAYSCNGRMGKGGTEGIAVFHAALNR